MTNVILGRVAEHEYADALVWYSNQSTRTASSFEQSFEKVLEQISSNPMQFAECEEDSAYRYATLSSFPYRVIYEIIGVSVRIVAVAHTSRQAGYWLDRK